MKPLRKAAKSLDEIILGDRGCWQRVGYAGRAFAPPPEIYAAADVLQLNYTTHADAGAHPTTGPGLGNLFPLVAAALYEAAFAAEAGPMTTWSN